ncbi:MAG TPA: GNAT family N-acetyltransferase [Xanthobacteraceae bacterium]|nr:GNAT family N-acetyltransferase [Xanthobacteraceae bacterium]
MSQARDYAASDSLRNGRHVEIRAIRPDDGTALSATVAGLSAASLRRRFFSVKRNFSEQEKAFFLNVDFANHVALVAELKDGERGAIVGGARYIVIAPATAEVAFAVAEEFQGQGLGTLLMRHLLTLARRTGLKTFVAEVLPENAPMLHVFANSGLELQTRHEAGLVHVTMRIS